MLSGSHHTLSHPHRLPPGAPLIPGLPATPQVSASTQAPSGDLNPYGVAFIPAKFPGGGLLNPGDVLVSNYNGPSNLQGTGTSLVKVAPDGASTIFVRTPAGTGLSTALGVLRRGVVVVGNLPSTDGTAATSSPGSLLFFDRAGRLVGEYDNPYLLDGPWDLTVDDRGSHASIFVSNALSGTVTRLDLQVRADGEGVYINAATQIGANYGHRPDPAAFLLGPTGLAFDARTDTLYVASTLDNAVYAIPNAEHAAFAAGDGRGSVIYADQAHLHGPLGLAFTPNGDLIVANGDAVNPDPAQPSQLVEFSKRGRFVAEVPIVPMPGAAFGLAVAPDGKGVRLAAVDDVTNQLKIFKEPLR